MSNISRRLLALSFDNLPIREPKPAHGLLLSAAGGQKTTAGAVTWLQSLIADKSRAIIVNDCKDGEIAAQCADMCAKYGRNVAIIDDCNVLGEENPHRVSITPFGSAIASKDNGELVFSLDNMLESLIEEPPDDAKNRFWREEPRLMLEICMRALLSRDPAYAAPGGLWSVIADPDVFAEVTNIEAEEGDEATAALAKHVADMRENNPDHYQQHRGAAVKALRIFSAGSILHDAGKDPEITHEQLIRDKYVIFMVGPQRYMDRLGPYYALHLQSFTDALLTGKAGPLDMIIDEFTNAPLKSLVSRLTTMRGYGGRCYMIAQSRSEIQRKYGEKETNTIEENAVVKQWFGFSSFEEAERVSKAMGEIHNVSHTLGINSEKTDMSGNIQTGRERLFTPDELMQLPNDEQIIHVKDIGFIHCKKVRQNEVAPYCFDLADNPLEGSRLPPDPKVHLPTCDDEREVEQ